MSNHTAVLGGRQASVSGLELTDLSTARVPRGPAGLGWTPAQRCGEDTDGDLLSERPAPSRAAGSLGREAPGRFDGRQAGHPEGQGTRAAHLQTPEGPGADAGLGQASPRPGTGVSSRRL